MNTAMRFGFSGSSEKPDPNITFYGLGNSLLTPQEISQGTSFVPENILNFVDDGVDLHLHIDTNFSLQGFGQTRFSPSLVDIKVNDNCKGIDDYNGLIKNISGNTLYQSTQPSVFNLQGLISVGKEGMRDVDGAVDFIAPNLEIIEKAGLSNLGRSNGGITFSGEFPLLREVNGTGLIQTKFKFTQDSPLMTGDFSLFRCSKAEQFPFENATEISSQGMRDCINVEGDVVLNNITGGLKGYLTFNNCRKVTRIIIPNCTYINDARNTFSNCNVLTEVDIRSATSWGDPTMDLGISNSNSSNLTIHANTALQTINSGSIHASLGYAQANGATIIWY